MKKQNWLSDKALNAFKLKQAAVFTESYIVL